MTKPNISPQGLTNRILWLAFLLALFSSVHHIAFAFGQLEFYAWLGWLPAIAIDGGLAAMAYAIQQRKRAKRSTVGMWLGVIAFTSISAVANYIHAVEVQSAIAWWKAVLFSASLPLLVVYLGEIVSGDDAVIAKAVEREARKEEREQEKPEVLVETIAYQMVGNRQAIEAKARNKAQLAAMLKRGITDRAEMAESLNVTKRTVSTYLAEISQNGKAQ